MIVRSVYRFALAGALVIGALPVAAQQFAADQPRTASVNATEVLSRPVTVQLDRVDLAAAIKAVTRSAGVRVQYPTAILGQFSQPVTLHAKRLPLRDALDHVLSGTGLHVIVLDDDLISVKAGATDARAEDGTIKGKVVDAKTDRPLKGVVILLDDQERGVQTAEDGTFRLPNVRPGTHQVHIRLIGYIKQTQKVAVTEGGSFTVNVALQPSVNTLNQVVVTGTVIPTEQRAISNTMTVITAEQLEARGVTHLDQLFRGDIPGLFAPNIGPQNKVSGVNSAYVPKMGAVTMYSRGSSTLPATGLQTGQTYMAPTSIKTYVDGVQMADPDYLNQIDPKSIERIEVITGPQASTLYGSDALNGVMLVFTKRGRIGGRPELAATLQYGTIENNFSSGHAPQHNYNAQLTDIVGNLTYNIGGTYSFLGQWTPGLTQRTFSGYGGGRRVAGPVTIDASLRFTSQYMTGGGFAVGQDQIQGMSDGWLFNDPYDWFNAPTSTFNVATQTYATTLGYTPFKWLHSQLILGLDQSKYGTKRPQVGFISPIDTNSIGQNSEDNGRFSGSFNTALDHDIGNSFHSTLTLGADWVKNTSEMMVLYGPKPDSFNYLGRFQRVFGRTKGGFGQWLLGYKNAVFLTVAVRAEENPNYGKEHRIDYAPRYGFSLVREIGPITAKGRWTYGKSTRPPGPNQRDGVLLCDASPGNCSYYTTNYGAGIYQQLPNPNLLPSSQSGPEGGIDLYFGNRASLSITHYVQKYTNQITQVYADSVTPIGNPSGYPYRISQWQNIGDIDNTGWESMATVNFGPLTVNGTWSLTMSRVARLAPTYRGPLGVGDAIQNTAEHTGSLTTSYASGATTVSVTANMVGQILSELQATDNFAYSNPNYRIGQMYLATGFGVGSSNYPRRAVSQPAQFQVDASRTLNRTATVFMHIVNATNYYQNEGNWQMTLSPTMGRQMFFGLRLRK